MRSVVKAASLGLAAGQGARELFAPVAPGQVYNQYPTQYVQYDAAPQYAYEQPVSINVSFSGRFGGGLEITPNFGGLVLGYIEADVYNETFILQKFPFSFFKLFRRKFNRRCLFPPRIAVSSKC